MRIRIIFLGWLLLMLSGLCLGAESGLVVEVGQSGDLLVVDANIEAPFKLKTVWDVLTDFDHMPAFLGNLTSSKIVNRDGNVWTVRQTGVARFGFLSFDFLSEREVRLEPMKRIVVRNLAGTVKRMTSETRLQAKDAGPGVQIRYHAEISPDAALVRIFGVPYLQHEIEEQYRAMLAEMKRRESNATLSAVPAAK